MNPQHSVHEGLSVEELARRLDNFRLRVASLTGEIRRAIVGYDELVNDCVVGVFSQGHLLLEGVPGLGKTYLVKVLSRVLGLSAGRVQCTPDLMPADILGTHIVGEDEHGRRAFRFEKGPVFKHLLLVDEINRATPKTQAALLEVMQEHGVTAGGERFPVPEPFFVLATQNPLEMEGTYPLPEAQLDRFFYKLRVPFPSLDQLVEISRRTTGFKEVDLQVMLSGEDLMEMQHLLTLVPIADPITRYAASLVLATHPEMENAPQSIKRFVAYGASPRALQAIVRGAKAQSVLSGRSAVSVEDIRRVAKPALRHRVILNFEGEAESVSVDQMVDEIIGSVATPAREAA